MGELVDRLVDNRTWTVVAICAVLAVGLAAPIGQRLGIGFAAAFAGLITTLPALAVVAIGMVDSGPAGGAAGRLLSIPSRSIDRWTWFDHGWDQIWSVATNDPAWLLGALIFVPAGAIWAIATGWPLPAWTWLVVAAFAAETTQSVTRKGVGHPADLVAGAVGAAVGVLLGTLLFRLVDGVAQSARRHPWWVVLIVLGAGVTGYALMLLSVDTRNDRLIHELRTTFTGYTSHEVLLYLDDDQSYMTPDELYSLTSVRPSTVVTDSERGVVELRYAVSSFGFTRCSIATFTTEGVSFARSSGSDCANARSAAPRWDIEFFSSSVISANVLPSPA